jgi:hypothetical protein
MAGRVWSVNALAQIFFTGGNLALPAGEIKGKRARPAAKHTPSSDSAEKFMLNSKI